MNKILNWTFGACFRTLGRFLAIFIVFALLLFVGSKLDIELPSWLALKVDALEITQDVKLFGSKQFYYTNSDLTENSIWTGKNFSRNNSLQYYKWNIDPNTYDYESNVDYIEIPLIIGQSNITKEDESSLTEYCLEWKKTTISGVEAYTCSRVSSTQNELFEYKPEIVLNNLNLGFYSHNTDGGYSMCQIQNNSILCPTRKMKIDFIGMFYFFKSESNIDSIPIYLGNVWQRYYITNFEEQINQNQQQTNNKLDDMNQTQNEIKDSINNNDTSGAQNSASGFFDNFSTETFGLTSIITAPLNAINSIINSTCNNLVLPLPFVEKNLTLPCMNSIYSNYFKGFFDLYQIITTGLISYYVIVRIFNLVKDFKNPEHDEIEVMDL